MGNLDSAENGIQVEHIREDSCSSNRKWISTKVTKEIKAVIASGYHLYPYRTEQLSPIAPMVLRKWESRTPPYSDAPEGKIFRGVVVYIPQQYPTLLNK